MSESLAKPNEPAEYSPPIAFSIAPDISEWVQKLAFYFAQSQSIWLSN